MSKTIIYPKKRQNPWLDKPYFRSGFWDLQPKKNSIFHVTPNARELIKSGVLSSRWQRNDSRQSLGGEHDVTTSYYGSFEKACYTLMFMYRVWQVDKGIISFEEIADMAHWEGELKDFYARYGTTEPGVLVRGLMKKMEYPDPIILSYDWLKHKTAEDFKIFCFKNPAKYLFLNSLNSTKSENEIKPIVNSVGMDILGNRILESKKRNYFGFPGHRKELVANHYGAFSSKLKYGFSAPVINVNSYKRVLNEINADLEKIIPEYKVEDCVYKIEDLTIDLRDFSANLDEIVLYEQFEQEFRLYQQLKIKDTEAIYDIDDVLKLATLLNNGIEPFFWDYKVEVPDAESFKYFKLSTFEE